MIIKVDNHPEVQNFMSGLTGRKFLRIDTIRRDLPNIVKHLISADSPPTKDDPGLYIFLYTFDKQDRILSFHHTDRAIYGVKAAGIGEWCRWVDRSVIAERALAQQVSKIFFDNFSYSKGVQVDLVGIYVNRFVTDDANKIIFVHQCTVDDLNDVGFESSQFFDPEKLTKEEAFSQHTTYDHWSSQILFSMCNPTTK